MRALLQFTKELPSDFVLAPIYRKDAVMESGKPATGKNPVEAAHKRNLNPADAALIVERSSKVGALGVWCGAKGNGLVILDVDRNLSALLKKWGETLSGAPVVRSPKKNAAKYLFRVPEALWGDLAGFGHSDEHPHGYEVLWNKRQALIAGEYPGGGEYTVEGDLHSIPDAPEWLIAEMKAAKAPTGLVKNRTALDLGDRTEDEVATIIQECLEVIPNEGGGSREQWIRIGMAIHSQLPGDLGLQLWSAWSAEDPEYHSEWQSGNPCEQPWQSFRPGRIGLGSLVWLADQVDPKRTRFQESSKQILEKAEAAKVQEIRTAVLTHAEVVKQAREILQLDNPSEINHRLNGLAIAAGYKGRESIEQLMLSQLEYERKEKMMSWAELSQEKFEKTFLIPDVLPHPSVVLIHGAGGDGKSMSAWTIAKHVAMGLPFVVRGRLMPVKQGPVLLLNGDQPKQQIQEQLEEIDMPRSAPIHIQSNWQLKRQNEFCQLMDTIQPALVVIDSLIGCSSGDAFDENKSSFASPLYWLTKSNGNLFPATTILIIHHSNKTGGFRGTSAIRDAVDETWALKRPGKEQVEKDQALRNVRFINIEKSRSGRSGTSLAMRMEADLTFSVSDATPEVDDKKTTPDGIVDRVLLRIRTIYPRTITKTELVSDPIVGGKVAAVKKALQRLEKKGLITSLQEEGRYGKKTYQAILARGEGGGECPPSDSVDPAGPPRGDNDPESGGSSPLDGDGGQLSEETPACPPSGDSAGAASDQGGHPDTYFRARDESFDRWKLG